jgi:hypothetical protein
VISAKQLLDWIEARNASKFRAFSWSGNTLGFTIAVGAGASGLEAMLRRVRAAAESGGCVALWLGEGEGVRIPAAVRLEVSDGGAPRVRHARGAVTREASHAA